MKHTAATVVLLLALNPATAQTAPPAQPSAAHNSAHEAGAHQTSSSTSTPVRGHGRLTAVHIMGAVQPEVAAAFEERLLRRHAEVAGVTHRVVASIADAGLPAAAASAVPPAGAGEAVVLLLRDDGAVAGSLALNPADARSIDALFAELTRASRTAGVDEYNVPKRTMLALEGYDPVSYFTAGGPKKGKTSLTSSFQGVVYRFASAEHLELFAADPLRYVPTYGGWCASAMGDGGRKVEIDPTNYKVKDGRLFLFYKSLLGDARKDWDKHEATWEPAADTYWKSIASEDAVFPAAGGAGGGAPRVSP